MNKIIYLICSLLVMITFGCQSNKSEQETIKTSKTSENEELLNGTVSLEYAADSYQFKNGFPVTVRATISRHNMDDLEDMAAFLLEDIGLPSMTNNEASPIGSGCTYSDEVALDHGEILAVGKRLKKLQEKYPGRISAQAGPLVKLRMYKEMEDAKATEKLTGRWKMGYLSSCGGVFSKLGVLHDGSIVPCSALHALTMGNILTDDLLELWHNSSVIRDVRDRYVVPLSQIEECKNCEWVKYCNGGCPGIVQQMQNTVMAPSWRSCYKNFLKFNNLRSIYDAYPQEETKTWQIK